MTTTIKELPWIAKARSYIGTTEIPGPRHNSIILNWLASLKAWWRDDETPWCGVFVAHCCKENNRYIPTHWMRALDWNNAGQVLDKPAYGCIVTFSRRGGGHVGFCVGKDKLGNLMILGGNQGNQVNIKPFNPQRVSKFIWPTVSMTTKSFPDQSRFTLPILNSNGKVSTNEA